MTNRESGDSWENRISTDQLLSPDNRTQINPIVDRELPEFFQNEGVCDVLISGNQLNQNLDDNAFVTLHVKCLLHNYLFPYLIANPDCTLEDLQNNLCISDKLITIFFTELEFSKSDQNVRKLKIAFNWRRTTGFHGNSTTLIPISVEGVANSTPDRPPTLEIPQSLRDKVEEIINKFPAPPDDQNMGSEDFDYDPAIFDDIPVEEFDYDPSIFDKIS